jgi:hypothetical protein
MSKVNGVTISKGNIKVSVPIVNMGSSKFCPSAEVCPFSFQNHKATGKPLCYAYKAERQYPAVLPCREANRAAIEASVANGTHQELAGLVAAEVAKIAKRAQVKFLRLNEAGDLCEKNVPFAVALVKAVAALGVKTYTYSKAPEAVKAQVREAGAVVLDSEKDFVCVKTEAEAKEQGLTLCPGEGCGKTCLRCCVGARSAIVAH